MKVSEKMIEQLKQFEGLRLEAYEDAGGVLTIGYGHTGEDISPGDRITEYWAKELLLNDLGAVEDEVEELGVARNQAQFDALVSFAFNLGISRLKSSTLLKVIRNGGSMRQIKREFMRWVHCGGQRLPGLEKRRAWEAKRFFEN
jgi:lysozyme